VYRAVEQPLPKTLPYAGRDLQRKWGDLLARVMPFDLVMDEHTADGQEARVSRSSVAGSWGAVIGNLRYFADRFGVPRASIEGTTISYDQVRAHAAWARARVVVSGPRKHQGLAVARRLTYFGFDLEDSLEPLSGAIPAELRASARGALVDALIAGETVHPRQGAVRRALHELDELWRRSGGTLESASPERRRMLVEGQVGEVETWEAFLRRPIRIEAADVIDPAERERLLALPSSARIFGDTVPVEYEVEPGTGGVVRLRLREGQARRLQEREVPRFDRPVRFAVAHGDHPPLRADTLAALREALRVHGGRRHRGRPRPPHRRR
jgi:hypothetical protein